VPAVERGFRTRRLPELVALDADFVVNVAITTEEFHRPCLSFSDRLRVDGVRIVFSPLLRLEFLQAWRKALNRGAMATMIARQGRLWDDPVEERQEYFARAERLFESFIDQFSRVEVRLDQRLQRETREQMAQHNLNSMDACLLATALRAGTDHIVSLDSDFRRVDGIDLWNDNIPAKRQAARRRKRS
jgi:predicted nucleic acid-binding protein